MKRLALVAAVLALAACKAKEANNAGTDTAAAPAMAPAPAPAATDSGMKHDSTMNNMKSDSMNMKKDTTKK